MRAGRLQGGSTITQQLARQSFLTPRQDLPPQAEGNHRRGATREAYSASTRFSSCISTRCISATACYGVEAASRGYFGKPAASLTVAEAALLAGLMKSPSSYAPTVSLERAIARRNVVLRRWSSSGAIDAADGSSRR